MKTEINGRDNQLVSYWPKGEREDAELVKLLMQLTSLDIKATLSADSYGPVVRVERNGHNQIFKAGTLLVVHKKDQLSVLPEDLVEMHRKVLQLDEAAETVLEQHARLSEELARARSLTDRTEV